MVPELPEIRIERALAALEAAWDEYAITDARGRRFPTGPATEKILDALRRELRVNKDGTFRTPDSIG